MIARLSIPHHPSHVILAFYFYLSVPLYLTISSSWVSKMSCSLSYVPPSPRPMTLFQDSPVYPMRPSLSPSTRSLHLSMSISRCYLWRVSLANLEWRRGGRPTKKKRTLRRHHQRIKQSKASFYLDSFTDFPMDNIWNEWVCVCARV